MLRASPRTDKEKPVLEGHGKRVRRSTKATAGPSWLSTNQVEKPMLSKVSKEGHSKARRTRILMGRSYNGGGEDGGQGWAERVTKKKKSP